jgi:alcohol dehydrogenase class IV
MYHLSHGLSNALLLPFVMEFNIVGTEKKYADVAIALGCQRKETDLLTAKEGVLKIKELNQLCGIPAALSVVGVKEADIPTIAKDAMKVQRLLKNNPRELTEADAIDIYKKALYHES